MKTSRVLGALAAGIITFSGAALWLASALVPAPVRFLIWMAAFALDLGTPWLLVEHSVALPPDPSHLPERFGLFTLILLGESVVALMRGVESQEYWPVEAAAAALLGMCLLFVVWWWYFDGIGAAEPQPVRSRSDALRFQIWSYARGTVRDVTREYPDRVARHADALWARYQRANGPARYVLAAWAADMYLLGRQTDADRALGKALKTGHPRDYLQPPSSPTAFLSFLRGFLRRNGYA